MAEMTMAEAAKELGMTKQGLDYHRRKGHITARKTSRFYMIDPEIARKELQRHIYRSNSDDKKELAEKEGTTPVDAASESKADVAAPEQK